MIFWSMSPGRARVGQGGASHIVKMTLFRVARSTGPSKVRIASTMRVVWTAGFLKNSQT